METLQDVGILLFSAVKAAGAAKAGESAPKKRGSRGQAVTGNA